MTLSQAFTNPVPSRRERARVRLLEAALRVFGEKGPEGAKVREVARAAGQNVAAIAYYFGGKKKLYQAVVEGLVRELQHRLGDLTGQIERLRREPEPSRAEALRLLKQFLGAVYLRFLCRQEAVHIARLVVREQLRPTAAFEIFYGQGFRQLHEALCFLVGVALGREPRNQEIILRTHMVMGQVYFFAMSRQAILRRLGWTSLEGRHAELVVELLEESLEALFTGLARRPGGRRRRRRARSSEAASPGQAAVGRNAPRGGGPGEPREGRFT